MITVVHEGGRDMGGLVSYLTGPGRSNEHVDQRVVAASGTLAVEFAGTDWDAAKNGELARMVDGAWRQVRRQQGLVLHPGKEDAGRGPASAEHVFHVSLSLAVDEGKLTDETWSRIAAEYVDEMGLDGPKTAAGGRAGCQWVAVNHGQSTGGGDHVHIAVCLVREDLTRASVHQSHRRSRQVTDQLEARHGLRPVKDRAVERGLVGFTKAEAGRAQRESRQEVAKAYVARRLRGAAMVSTSETEFVAGARAAGVMVRPRFAAASIDQVVGYSAAARPGPGEQAIWYAPSKLDRNLGLGQLRARWGADPKGSDAAGAAAVAAWRSTKAHGVSGADVAGAGIAVAGPGVGGMRALPPETAAALAGLTGQLAKIDATDRAGWQAAAREASHVFARWSIEVEGAKPGPLARASDALARSAQPDRDQRGPTPCPGLGARHVELMVRATSKSQLTGTLALLAQLDRLTQAIQDAHAARNELVAAQRMEASTGSGLSEVRAAVVAAAGPAAVAGGGVATLEAEGPFDAAATGRPGSGRPGRGTVVGDVGEGGVEETPAQRAARIAALSFPAAPNRAGGTRGPASRPPASPSAAPPRRERTKDSERDAGM